MSRPAGRVRRVTGRVVAILAGCCLLLLAGHRFVPNLLGAGSLLETFLPWLGVPVALAAVAALALRSLLAGVAVVAAVVAWAMMFGSMLVPAGEGPAQAGSATGARAPGGLRVLTHNVWERNERVPATARAMVAPGADVVAVQEVRPEWLAEFAAPLDTAFPHRAVLETYGVWSRYPVTSVRAVQPPGVGATVAVRMLLATPAGPVALYNVHVISPDVTRRGFGGGRDAALRGLTEALAADDAPWVVLVGDLNTAPADRRGRHLLRMLDSAHEQAGSGFGFTWPARLPLARIDHVLLRGLRASQVRVLGPTGSDHLPVLADLRLPTTPASRPQ